MQLILIRWVTFNSCTCISILQTFHLFILYVYCAIIVSTSEFDLQMNVYWEPITCTSQSKFNLKLHQLKSDDLIEN